MKCVQKKFFFLFFVFCFVCNCLILSTFAQNISIETFAGTKWRLVEFNIQQTPDSTDYDYDFQNSNSFEQLLENSFVAFNEDGTYEENLIHIKKTGIWKPTELDFYLKITYNKAAYIAEQDCDILIQKIDEQKIRITFFNYDGKIVNLYEKWE